MEEAHRQEIGRLVGGLPHDEYLKASGRVQMLETIYNLIDTLDNSAREIDEHSAKRSTAERDTRDTIDARRTLAFSGSPYYTRK